MYVFENNQWWVKQDSGEFMLLKDAIKNELIEEYV
jgi:hypothetical protein